MRKTAMYLLLLFVGCKCLLVLSEETQSVVSNAEEFGTTGLKRQEFEHWKTRAYEAIGSGEQRKELTKELEEKYPKGSGPELIRMLHAVASESPMGPSDGWFGPGESLYDWNWLKHYHDVSDDDFIDASRFRGSSFYFDRLDRDGDGRIQASDLDWEDSSKWVAKAATLNRLFRTMDAEGDNQISKEELLAFFDNLRGKQSYFTSEDLRDHLLRGRKDYLDGDAPTADRLLKGLFNNEVGSPHQGPKVGELAPDFTLKLHDASRDLTLSSLYATKPVVLVFGNFTCGPFRRTMPEIEDLHRRYQDQATFVGVYVREAHPTDGWAMTSNAKQGVEYAQPATYQQRVSVAATCHETLQYTMPLLVDTIDDQVGNAYSGMPSRLYVIDREGRVVYKGGRGPYGLKVGEMEQALVMALVASRP